MKPISPQEVLKMNRTGKNKIPDSIIKIVNNLLVSKQREMNRMVDLCIDQESILVEINKSLKLKNEEVFKNGWLNFEPLFETKGWIVEYRKADYGEVHSYFIFSAKKGQI